MKLPHWYDKLQVGMEFKNCDELAEFLGVEIRLGTNDKQRLMDKVKCFFVVEYLPPKDPTKSKRSYAFKIVERKEVSMLVSLTMEEYKKLKELINNEQ